MNLVETNHQINMTSDHSVSSNNSFKSLLSVKNFNMFINCSGCAKHNDSASVSVAQVMWLWRGDINSASAENWKEPLSSTISTEAPFNGDSNLNKI